MVIADFYQVDGAVFTEKAAHPQAGLLTRQEYAENVMRDPADFYYGVLWNKLYRHRIIEEHQLEMDRDLRWCEDFLFQSGFIHHAERFTIRFPFTTT